MLQNCSQTITKISNHWSRRHSSDSPKFPCVRYVYNLFTCIVYAAAADNWTRCTERNRGIYSVVVVYAIDRTRSLVKRDNVNGRSNVQTSKFEVNIFSFVASITRDFTTFDNFRGSANLIPIINR